MSLVQKLKNFFLTQPKRQECIGLMPKPEKEFLNLIAPLGVDWTQTNWELYQKFPAEKLDEKFYKIKFPETQVFSSDPLSFTLLFSENSKQSLPDSLDAIFNKYPNPGESYKELERQFIAKLGPGEPLNIPTFWGRRWSYGIFTIKIESRPYELRHQSPSPQRDYNHALDDMVRIGISALSIQPYPKSELNWIAEAILRPSCSSSQEVLKFSNANESPMSLIVSESSSRTSVQIADNLNREDFIFWKDKSLNQIGAGNNIAMTEFLLNEKLSLCLLKLHESRGPDAAELGLRGRAGQDSLFNNFITVNSLNGLDNLAERLSKFWGIPLLVEETSND